MKKHLIISLFVVCVFFMAKAQTFSTRFSFEGAGIGTHCYSVELRDSFIFVGGIYADTTVNNGIASCLAKFDYEGNMVSKVSLRPQGYPHYVIVGENSLITTSDNGLAATGYAKDSTGKLLLCFTKFDSTGNLQFYKIITPNVPGYKTVFGYRVFEYPGRGYYIAGTMQLANFQVKAFLCLLDFVGDTVFLKYYNSPTYYDACRGMTMLTNGNLLLSIGGEDNNFNAWESFGCTRLLEVDTLGFQKKINATTDSNTFCHYNISPSATDENYFTCGKYVTERIVNQSYQNQCSIIKWDTSFNPIWKYHTGIIPHQFNSFTDFEQIANGDIVICGYEVCGLPCGSGVVGKITKTDKDGNLLFNRNYKGYNSPTDPSNDYNYLYDVDLMANGDIIAVGYSQAQGVGQTGWLLRINADGCMDDGWCGYTYIDEKLETSRNFSTPIQVYPNPSFNGIFTVFADVDLPPASCITVFDVTGNQLLRQPLFEHGNLLNLYHLPGGMYFYEVGNGVMKVTAGKLMIAR